MEQVYAKICLAGEGGVGKTTLAKKLATITTARSGITIGIDFHVLKLSLDDISLNVLIFDLGGQQQFREILWDFFAGTECIILTYDISRPATAKSLELWLERLKPFKDIIIVVGNKKDIANNGYNIREILYKYEISRYVETSALTGEGLSLLLQKILEVIVEQKSAQIKISQK